jgi:hypothetical protein
MNGLQEIQSGFQDYVLGDGAVAPDLQAAIRQQLGLAAPARLAIYHNAYRARMREALGEAFERTWTYAGDARFGELADAYLAAHTSTFSNLRWFGNRFADFVRRQLPGHQCVAELAAFEWALGLAFDAPEAKVAGAATFAALAPGQWADLVLTLHPSVQRLRMDFNSVALWQALGEGREPPAAAALPAACTWLVWRKDNQPHFRSLDAFEAAALAAVAAGNTFGNICEQAAAGAPDAAVRIGACLQDWMRQSMLADSSNRVRIGIE